jgi:hypothetical protein
MNTEMAVTKGTTEGVLRAIAWLRDPPQQACSAPGSPAPSQTPPQARRGFPAAQQERCERPGPRYGLTLAVPQLQQRRPLVGGCYQETARSAGHPRHPRCASFADYDRCPGEDWCSLPDRRRDSRQARRRAADDPTDSRRTTTRRTPGVDGKDAAITLPKSDTAEAIRYALSRWRALAVRRRRSHRDR